MNCYSFFSFSFHEKDSESPQIVIENLSKYLLRKNYITNILIGNYKRKLLKIYKQNSLDDLKKCFDSHMISIQLLNTLVDQTSITIKECYHATPDSLLNLLLTGCNHSTV